MTPLYAAGSRASSRFAYLASRELETRARRELATSTDRVAQVARDLPTQTSSDVKKILVITSATSQIAPIFARKGIERGYDKLVLLSRKTPEAANQDPRKTWVRTGQADAMSQLFWEQVFGRYCSEGDTVHVINTIGSSVAPKGISLDDINVKPLEAIQNALVTQRARTSQKVGIGHLSSIAVTYFPENPDCQVGFGLQAIDYCSGRLRADRLLHESDIPSVIIRPGFIFTDLKAGRVIDTGHPYSPEQFASMLIQPIAGSGEQVQQPVYAEDIAEGMLNGLETGENHLVNAVGPDSMTQKEMFKFFTDLAGKPFRPVYIPLELAAIVAKHVPKGRVAPYAISMFNYLERKDLKDPLSSEPFEQLVGRPLLSMANLYSNLDGATFVLPTAPIQEHTKEILQVLWNNPEARKDFSSAVYRYGMPICAQAILALLL